MCDRECENKSRSKDFCDFCNVFVTFYIDTSVYVLKLVVKRRVRLRTFPLRLDSRKDQSFGKVKFPERKIKVVTLKVISLHFFNLHLLLSTILGNEPISLRVLECITVSLSHFVESLFYLLLSQVND